MGFSVVGVVVGLSVVGVELVGASDGRSVGFSVGMSDGIVEGT